MLLRATQSGANPSVVANRWLKNILPIFRRRSAVQGESLYRGTFRCEELVWPQPPQLLQLLAQVLLL